VMVSQLSPRMQTPCSLLHAHEGSGQRRVQRAVALLQLLLKLSKQPSIHIQRLCITAHFQ
jgi:hypothetical protein